MRPLAILIFLVLAGTFLCDISGITTKTDIHWNLFDSFIDSSENTGINSKSFSDVSFPVTLNQVRAQSLVGFIRSKGYKVTGTLDFEVTGKRVVLGHNDELNYLSPKNKSCKVVDSNTFTCRVLIHTQSESVDMIRLYSPEKGQVTVQSAEFTEARMKRSSILGGNIIYAYFFILAGAGPLFYYLRKKRDVELYCLIFVASVFCAILSISSFFFIVIFLLTSFLFIVQLQKEKKDKKRLLFCLILFSIVILLVVKVSLPYIGYIFANPGRFWFLLPLGFSYFIIRLIDLALNVYSGFIKEIRLLDFLAFMAFPATLPAGPIFTFDQFLEARISGYCSVDYGAGLARVSYGVMKKLFADAIIYPFVLAQTNVFITDPGAMNSYLVMEFLFANTLFVFLDFSAYSDMAIGAGRAMGWKVPENFNLPLLQTRLRNFWQCWHMTLSNWVMRRVYMSAIMSSRSITLSTFACMLTIGLWHTVNLSWTFWAVHHTLIMTLERNVLTIVKWPSFLPKTKGLEMMVDRFKLCLGICFVWFWVSLGHSFTLFSNINMAFEAYLSALQGPFYLLTGGV